MDHSSIIPAEFEWPQDWEPVGARAGYLELELKSELPEGHVLKDVQVLAIAQHVGTDDVVFVTNDPLQPIAIVHLTWSGKPDLHPKCPWTDTYKNLPEALLKFASE